MVLRWAVLVEIFDADPMELFGLVVWLNGCDDGQPVSNVCEHPGAWQLGSY
jgi:hypothetical protein